MADESVRVDHLSVAFESRTVLDDVSFRLAAGERLGLVGPNGSGKTTLIRALYRSVGCLGGDIVVGGTSIAELDRKGLAQRVAVLRQEDDVRFDFTVGELVLMGRSPYKRWFEPERQDDHASVKSALSATDTMHLANRRFQTLSGGERRRVMLARALAQTPTVLLLDEPTNHLDVRHQLEVLACIEALGITVVAAFHDLNLAARFSTQVLVLEGGRVASLGPPRAVLDSDLIRRVFGVEAQWLKVGPLSRLVFGGLSGSKPDGL